MCQKLASFPKLTLASGNGTVHKSVYIHACPWDLMTITIHNNNLQIPSMSQLTKKTTCSLIPTPSVYSNLNLSTFSLQSYFLLLCSHIHACSLQFQEHKCEHDSTNKSRDEMRLAFPGWCTHNLSLKCGKVPCKFKFSLYERCRMQLWLYTPVKDNIIIMMTWIMYVYRTTIGLVS